MGGPTPGPWRVVRHEINGRPVRIEIYGPDGCGRGGKPVAFLPSGFVNLEADMALIAAAPDLLAALEEAVAGAKERDEDMGANCWPKLLAAIALARGGT